MKKKRVVALVLAVVIVLSSVSMTVVAVANDWQPIEWITNAWSNKPDEDNSIVKYEKPSVGEIAGDGEYPDEIKSSASDAAVEKQWYEYVTYSKTSIGEVSLGTKKYVFYDPLDYTYGIVMEISNTSDAFGDFYDSEGFSTANEIQVSYSTSTSASWAYSVSNEVQIEAEVALEEFGVKVGTKIGTSFGISEEIGISNESSSSKTVSYNAIYFNSQGTPYRWRIVHYTVYLPLYCEIMQLVDGQWVVTDTNYCLLATVQGTCREWINNIAYIEDWRTGEPIAVENFWKDFFTKEDLIEAYTNRLTPAN